MKTQKDELATLSRNQQNPGLAQPLDFEIVSDDADIFHGQRSDALIKQSEKCRGKSPFVGKQP